MTAPDSSSSDINPLFELELAATGRLAPLPAALLAGRDLELLAPLRFLPPGELAPAGPAVDRRELASALAEANQQYGHPRAAELAQKLADPNTRVIVSGQQPGLWGGPLLGLVKALAAVRYAEACEAAGHPAVAVFWMATEDHDWSEATRATLLGKQAVRFDLGEDPEPLRPVGQRTLPASMADVDAAAREVLGAGPVGERWTQGVGNLYQSGITLGEAFARLLVTACGERAPLLLDAQLPALKRAQRPFLRRLITERSAVDAAYAAAEEVLEQRGYTLQVRPQRGASPLFLIHEGGRRRIEWRGENQFGLRGVDTFTGTVDELLDIVERSPERLSPGVLARPAIQDAVLGTALQVMGPAELTYLGQAAAVYPLLGLSAPATTLRPQVLLVDPKQASWLAELNVSLHEILTQTPESLVASRLEPDRLGPLREQVQNGLANVRDAILALDASLENPWRKTQEQIDRALEQLQAKVAAAAGRRHEVWLRRLEQLRQYFLPLDHLQERELAIGYFLARYGSNLATEILKALDLDSRRLSVVRLGENPAGG